MAKFTDSVQFLPLGHGLSVATIDGETYIKLSTDAGSASRTESGATDMTASTGPWVDVPGVPAHPDHKGKFKVQLNAGYRVPKGNRQ